MFLELLTILNIFLSIKYILHSFIYIFRRLEHES